jgi:two-component SAPR family response regulator
MIESSDLFRFRQLSADGVLPEDLERALKIYGEGGLAPEVEAPWIGPVREHTHREAQRTACRLSEAYDEEADWKKMELLGQQVLSWDDLDDDGIRMVVKGLYKSRKISLAREEYLKFAERYRREIEEEYEIQFDGLVE